MIEQQELMNNKVENFFIKKVAANEYQKAKMGITEACRPPKKKIYRNLNKMLEEGFLIGSLKYGNNFIF